MTNHTTSLEISKKLKEAGWKKETEFWWVRTEPNGQFYINYKLPTEFIQLTQYPAPLATEILEELPKNIHYFIFDDGDYHCVWHMGGTNQVSFQDKSLPNALAKMWIYLKQSGLLK